jgi:hypothetical protein
MGNFVYATNVVTLCSFIFVLLIIGRIENRVPLAFVFVYTFPFLFLVERGGLHGHFISISVFSVIAISMVIDDVIAQRETILIPGLWLAILLGSLVVSSASMIYGASSEHGSVAVDVGTKAAAYWIRSHTGPDAIVFADPYAGHADTVARYYYHRTVVSLEVDEVLTKEMLVDLATANEHLINVAVLGLDNAEPLATALRAPERWKARARISVSGVPKLVIFVRNSREDTLEDREASDYNWRYDVAYTQLSSVISFPFEYIQASQPLVRYPSRTGTQSGRTVE